MITAILNGSIEQADFELEPVFGFSCPKSIEGVNTESLNPRSAWDNANEYDLQAAELAKLFIENFKTYGATVSYLESAGPLSQQELAI